MAPGWSSGGGLGESGGEGNGGGGLGGGSGVSGNGGGGLGGGSGVSAGLSSVCPATSVHSLSKKRSLYGHRVSPGPPAMSK